MEALGGHCVFSSELHPTAQAVYRENWPGGEACGSDALVGDIRIVRTEEVPEHDLLTAGFPCQPFSALGAQDGLQESRGRLFLQICRVLRVRRPPMALLENVPGLVETDEGRALETVLNELRDSGYRVAHRIYNSSCLLPQKRKRVYIVAIRADLTGACEAFRFPWLPDLCRTLGEVVEQPLDDELESLLLSEDRWQKLLESRAFAESPTDILGRLDGPAAPLVSSYGEGSSKGQFLRYTPLVPGTSPSDRPRRLSCRECARLQGFPEDFRHTSCDGPRAWYRLIGNAVSPPVVCALGGALVCAWRHPDRGCWLPGTLPACRLAIASGPVGIAERLLERRFSLPSRPSPSVACWLAWSRPPWSRWRRWP